MFCGRSNHRNNEEKAVSQKKQPQWILEGPQWYEGFDNWNICKAKMMEENANIHRHFTGDIEIKTRPIAQTSLEKAKDAMYQESNGKAGTKYQPKVEQYEVIDCFRDPLFPGQNSSWFRGQGAETIEDYKQPMFWKHFREMGNEGKPYEENQPSFWIPIHQGCLEDFYFVQAAYAIGMKSKLVEDVFVNLEYSNDSRLGSYILRFYKNAQWIHVAIDDCMPYDKKGNPMCCRSEGYPAFPWASLLEKAYAKLHGSWEAISGGGSVEEVMVDLTGGCAGRFHTTDVANDRLWKYLHELQATCVWGVSIDTRECSKRLIPIDSHYASAIQSVAMHNGVPYICVCTSAPDASVKHFPMCKVPSPSPGLWLRIDDFAQLFDAVYECRLVNSDVNPRVPGNVNLQEPIERPLPTPGYDHGSPWFEYIFAYRGEVTPDNAPTFLIDVPDAETELTMDIGQRCQRYERWSDIPTNSRHEQAPLLLRFFQCGRDTQFQILDRPQDAEYMAGAHGSGEMYLVHMSAWAHARDAMCCVKVLRPGRYLACVSMPAVARSASDSIGMVFRTYASKKVGIRFLQAHRSMIAVNPGMPLCAIPYSLTGFPRIDEYSERLPRMFEEDEGKGKMESGPEFQREMQEIKGWLEGDNAGKDDGLKTTGYFGGPNAQATTNATETKGKGDGNDCSLM